MTKTIPGVYEEGIIRPLRKLPLMNHQKVELRIEIPKSTVRTTKAIIHIGNRFGRLIAESPRFSPLGS